MSETTLVQDIETNRRNGFSGSYRGFLDDRSPGAQLASVKFYKEVDGTDMGRYSNRLNECRTRAWFIRNKETGKVRIAAKQCRLRWCYHCSESRQQFITQAIAPWWNNAPLPKLLTVTVRHSDDPLDEQIEFLYKSFVKLRNRKLCKDAIKGGIWFFQVTWNKKTEQWHPHIHALIDSNYIDHAELKVAWKKITQGSTIVHIRAVHNPDKTLSHNARYAARPSALLNLPEERWPEMYDAFKGKRICGTWGSAKEISLRPAKPDDSTKWESIGGFRTVAGLVDEDENASKIWRAWQMSMKLDEGINMNDIEEFTGDRFTFTPRPPKYVEPALDFR